MKKFKQWVLIPLAVFASAAAATSAFGNPPSSDSTTVISTVTVGKAGPGSGSGSVVSDVPGIDCGATCSAPFNNGIVVTLTAAPAPTQQFTGWLGPCTGTGPCSFTVNGAVTAVATFAPAALGAPRIDIDDSGTCDAMNDGLLVLRYLFGLSGSPLVQGAIGAEAGRSTGAQIAGYLDAFRPALDIDGNGTTDALTDGLMIIRYLLGLRGAALTSNAIGPNATRSTAAAIETRMQELCKPPAPITAESCNGRDDQGNGLVDENLGTFSTGMGACRNTVAACSAGALNRPFPGAPTAESCNGTDDNCNGAIDEDGCSCVHVSPLGSDLNPGTAASPMRTIQAAIAVAANVGPKQVCVASGLTCLTVANYDENVIMADGVSVHGGYQHSGAIWPRTAACVTRIRPSVAEGVRFPVSVVQPTTLFNFTITAPSLPTTSAITIDGAHNAMVSNVTLEGGTGLHTYGVNVVNGGSATIFSSQVVGGIGSVESIGVRVVNAQATVSQNCDATDAAGRCTSPALSAASQRRIRARPAGAATGSGESYAVLLDNSPNSIVESSALGGVLSNLVAGVRIKGDGTGIRVRGNNIYANGGAINSHGVWAEDCGGATPWIVDNSLIAATGTAMASLVSGIRVIGSCHPVIESNVRIEGGYEGSGNSALTGVHCGQNASLVGSRCVIDNNALIRSGIAGSLSKTAIVCDDDSCGRIERNVISNASTTGDAVGIKLGRTAAHVEGNDISAGCGTSTSSGIVATGSGSRIVNNFIRGAFGCANPAAVSRGVMVINTADAWEVDLHSNTIVAGGVPPSCTSVALDIDSSGSSPPSGGKGRYRNNILHGGECTTSYGVRELAAGADPRIFRFNDIFLGGGMTALYLNEGTTPLATAAPINALSDMGVSQVKGVDPLFVNYPADLKLQMASPLRAAGTGVGAPTKDFFGQVRSASTPSIGADESP